jgi:hypothetical protein
MAHDLWARLARMSDAQLFELGQLHAGVHPALRPLRHVPRGRRAPQRAVLLRALNHSLCRGFRTTKQRKRKHIQVMQPATAVHRRRR